MRHIQLLAAFVCTGFAALIGLRCYEAYSPTQKAFLARFTLMSVQEKDGSIVELRALPVRGPATMHTLGDKNYELSPQENQAFHMLKIRDLSMLTWSQIGILGAYAAVRAHAKKRRTLLRIHAGLCVMETATFMLWVPTSWQIIFITYAGSLMRTWILLHADTSDTHLL